jgi:hypothetical protein
MKKLLIFASLIFFFTFQSYGQLQQISTKNLQVNTIQHLSIIPITFNDNVFFSKDILSDALYNSYFGTQSGNKPISTGYNNVWNGFQAGFSNTTGTGNNAVGNQTLYSNTIGGYNNAVGNQALYNNTIGNWNNAFGESALNANTTGTENTAIGDVSLLQNISGNYNSGVGVQSLRSNLTGGYNTAIGEQTFYSNTVGDNNTALGGMAGFYVLGSNNVCLGYRSGYYETGSNMLYIGNGLGVTDYGTGRSLTPIVATMTGVQSTQQITINGNDSINGNVYISKAIIQNQLSGTTTYTLTTAEINTITGLTPSTAGAGYQVSITSTDHVGVLFRVESDGTRWYAATLTQAP